MTVNTTVYATYLNVVPANARWQYEETAREEDGSTVASAGAAIWARQNPALVLATACTAARKAAVAGVELSTRRKGTAGCNESASRALRQLARVQDFAEVLPQRGAWKIIASRIAADAVVAQTLVKTGERRRASEALRALSAYVDGAADFSDIGD